MTIAENRESWGEPLAPGSFFCTDRECRSLAVSAAKSLKGKLLDWRIIFSRDGHHCLQSRVRLKDGTVKIHATAV